MLVARLGHLTIDREGGRASFLQLQLLSVWFSFFIPSSSDSPFLLFFLSFFVLFFSVLRDFCHSLLYSFSGFFLSSRISFLFISGLVVARDSPDGCSVTFLLHGGP